MDKVKIQDFTSLINHLRQKTAALSVFKNPLKQVSLSLFQRLKAQILPLAAICALKPGLERLIHFLERV
ncbi:MAG TPA: hypothetical protein VGU44_02755 [Gammaproteobacteria bacterium]|nr:hypothetical protein [Gammaproteobacteria bacterium]